jgi:hypothetical protein
MSDTYYQPDDDVAFQLAYEAVTESPQATEWALDWWSTCPDQDATIVDRIVELWRLSSDAVTKTEDYIDGEVTL